MICCCLCDLCRHERDNPNITPAPHDYSDKDFRSIYSTGRKKKGISFGVKHKDYTTDYVPGPQYKVGRWLLT